MKRFAIAAAILVLIVAMAVGGLILRDRNAKTQERDETLAEIGRIADALEQYKRDHGYYPLCFGHQGSMDFFIFADTKEMPRGKAINSATANHEIRWGTDTVVSPRDSDHQQYLFKSADGTVKPLDIESLDPAESIVFWLGGFPTPCDASGKPVAARRLFGFSSDPQLGLARASSKDEGADPLSLRTKPRYDFAEDRLTDIDDDGWLEYRLSSDPKAPPLVYFDGDTLRTSIKYENTVGTIGYPFFRPPYNGAKDPGDAIGKLQRKFGVARPYLLKFDPDQPKNSVWQRADSYQLIAAGRDHRYGWSQTEHRFTEVPSGKARIENNYGVKLYPIMDFPREELDNVTNIFPTTIGDALQAAK